MAFRIGWRIVVAAAADTVVFGSRYDYLEILVGREMAGDQREEARPARSAVEFHRRGE